MLGAINKSIISPSGNMFAMSTGTSGGRLELNARIIESWPTSHSPDVSLNTYFGCQWFMLRQPLQFIHLVSPLHPPVITCSCQLIPLSLFRTSTNKKKKKEKGFAWVVLPLLSLYPIASLPIEFNNVRIKDLFPYYCIS